MLIPTSKKEYPEPTQSWWFTQQRCMSMLERRLTTRDKEIGDCCWLLKRCWSITSCSHFNFIIQRYHDHWMGFNRASLTLMKKILILKSVSMPTQRCSNHMKTFLLKDDLKILILDNDFKETPKIIQDLRKVIKHSLLDVQRHVWRFKVYELQDFKNARIQYLSSGVTSLRGRLLGIRIFR